MNPCKLLSLVSLLVPLCSIAQTTIQNTTYSNGQNITVKDASTIAANTNVTVSSGAVVKFRANLGITLGPGFKADSGSSFRAFLFIDSDGDGMDDAWENTHTLDPNSSSDAAGDPDGDGISNLSEYLLGTNPRAARQADSTNSTLLNTHRP